MTTPVTVASVRAPACERSWSTAMESVRAIGRAITRERLQSIVSQMTQHWLISSADVDARLADGGVPTCGLTTACSRRSGKAWVTLCRRSRRVR
jgi:hypothetical protein